MRKSNTSYANKCRNTLRRFHDTQIHGAHLKIDFPRRKYIYSDELLTSIYALSILAGQDSFERRYLRQFSHFTGIERIDFSIRIHKLKNILPFDMVDNEAIQHTMKTFVDFLDSRFSEAIRYIYADGTKAFFSIVNPGKLNVDTISLYNFFEKFRTLLGSEFEVYISTDGGSVDCDDLSEGQRQLIKILGMLGTCKSENCLVLMDEPDVHMNPQWKYELKTIIDQSLAEATNTQAIIATHDPLVINGVNKEFIRIFTFNQAVLENNGFYITKVIKPQEDTAGLGIDGLLQSEYYGLPTILDVETQKKVDDKRDLLVKKVEGTITDPERKQLDRLTEEIEDMTFTRNLPTDNLYDEYVAAIHRIYKNRPKIPLTAKDIEERNAKVEEILRELMNK